MKTHKDLDAWKDSIELATKNLLCQGCLQF